MAFTLAVIIFLIGGILILRKRHQLFDRDPNVENDVPAVRHNRMEEILFVWSGLTVLLIAILYQVWSDDVNNFKSQRQTQNPQET